MFPDIVASVATSYTTPTFASDATSLTKASVNTPGVSPAYVHLASGVTVTVPDAAPARRPAAAAIKLLAFVIVYVSFLRRTTLYLAGAGE